MPTNLYVPLYLEVSMRAILVIPLVLLIAACQSAYYEAKSLFAEWEEEINQYSNARLKSASQAKLRETRSRYNGMMTAMCKSEAKMDPVLRAMNDNVLYLKHKLNAKAVASLQVEFSRIEQDIEVLIVEMRKSIASSDAFIASMK